VQRSKMMPAVCVARSPRVRQAHHAGRFLRSLGVHRWHKAASASRVNTREHAILTPALFGTDPGHTAACRCRC